MRLLLDTNLLLWAIATPEKLPATTRAELELLDVDVLFSEMSIWEVALKMKFGRLDLPVPPLRIAEAAVAMGFVEVRMHRDHAALSRRLPLHHHDPFDRMLVAQAIHEPARLLTTDKLLARYSDVVQVIA